MKLGILGGTFNPPHNAHMEMAALARDTLGLDRVLLMVAADPPHKRVAGQVPAQDRLSMARLAAESLPKLEASDLELLRDGKSYTADTLAALSEQYPGAELYLILGSDMLLDLKTWRTPERIMRLAAIAAVARQGQCESDRQAAQALEAAYHARVTLLSGEVPPISSTSIRRRLEAGLPVADMLPPSVERYCYEEGLYFPERIRRIQRMLRQALNHKRYVHTIGTVRTAAALAEAWGADPEQARLAALLHDCAKDYPPAAQAVLGGDDTGIPSVQHAFAGAVVAKNRYGVSDQAVLRAIRLHSTGDAGMTLLDKITYLADLTEPNRRFPCVDTMRGYLKMGPDHAMYKALLRTKDYVERGAGQGCDGFHPAGERALADLTQRCAMLDAPSAGDKNSPPCA